MYIIIYYSGAHPRLGALDVCPFIPIKGVTMDDCVKCAHQFSERLVKELNVPGKLTCIDQKSYLFNIIQVSLRCYLLFFPLGWHFYICVENNFYWLRHDTNL